MSPSGWWLALVLLIFLSSCSPSPLSKGQHTTSNLSQGRAALAGAAAGKRVLFAGGINPIFDPTDRVDIYDTSAGGWSAARLSLPRSYLAGAGVGNKVFFAGGSSTIFENYTDRVDIYDTSANRWTTARLSMPRGRIASTTVGNKVLFAGGTNISIGYMNVVTDRVDIYDADLDRWSIAQLSQPRSQLAATSLGNKAFFAGGVLNEHPGYTDRVDIYDADSDSWSVARLSQPRFDLVGASSGTKVLFAGGAVLPSVFTNVVDIYDVDADTWTASTLSQNRSNLAAASVGSDQVFFAGGYSNDPLFFPGYMKLVDTYDTSTDTWDVVQLSLGRMDLVGVSLAGTAFFAGGYNGTWMSQVDVYRVSSKRG